MASLDLNENPLLELEAYIAGKKVNLQIASQKE
jgi:hypothetical protein